MCSSTVPPTEQEFRNAVLDRMKTDSIRNRELYDCTWEVTFYVKLHYGPNAEAILENWTNKYLEPYYPNQDVKDPNMMWRWKSGNNISS